MRTAQALIGLGTLTLAATALQVQPAGAVCSVFARHPCFPTVCGVFGRYPCFPDYWIGQDLRLTIVSVSTDAQAAGDRDQDRPDASDHKLDTLRAMFDALRACWIPPASDVSPGTPPETRETYLHAITAALERCTPLPFTDGLGGAVAGRPRIHAEPGTPHAASRGCAGPARANQHPQ